MQTFSGHMKTNHENKMWGHLCGALMLLVVSGIAAANPPDLSGVWQVSGVVQELKTTDGKAPPLTPEAAKRYAENRALWRAGDLSFDPSARCISAGMPRVLTLPYPFKIFQSAERVFFLFEWNRWFRTVKLTQNDLEVPYPMSMGVARGRWQGDTLVVEISGLRADNTLLDSAGMPRSEQMQLTERIRLIDRNTLEDRLSIHDPATFTVSWDTVLRFKRLPAGAEIKQDVCLDRVDAGQPAIDWKKALRR